MSHSKLLSIAQATVWGDNERSGWHPVNGLCLAWPSATRVTDGQKANHSRALLDRYEAALNVTMQANFWPSMSGGGLEQVGATVAVNELLLQSHEGFLAFFPAWDRLKAASFVTLRARGAFLVSASVDGGVVGVIQIISEQGAPCLFKSPWTGTPVVTTASGSVPVVATVIRGVNVWKFLTQPATTYTISNA